MFIQSEPDFAGYTLSRARYDRAAGGIVVDKSAGGDTPGAMVRGVVESSVIPVSEPFDHAIVSWNAFTPAGSYLTVYLRARVGGNWTNWYKMGLWNTDGAVWHRTTFGKQQDSFGEMDCETLKLTAKADAVKLRVQLESSDGLRYPTLRFVALTLNDSSITSENMPPVKSVWGKELDVPYMSQLSVPGGSVWCSPTSTSMLLRYWGKKLNRPDMTVGVTEAASAIRDTGYGGTGNWSFNVAFAGEFAGIRAYVTRFTSISQIEDWIAKGVPVVVSLDYSRLTRGKSKARGHLMVIRGFTTDGSPVFNDPGSRPNSPRLRKVFTRDDLDYAWLGPGGKWGTVYIIYPEGYKL